MTFKAIRVLRSIEVRRKQKRDSGKASKVETQLTTVLVQIKLEQKKGSN